MKISGFVYNSSWACREQERLVPVEPEDMNRNEKRRILNISSYNI